MRSNRSRPRRAAALSTIGLLLIGVTACSDSSNGAASSTTTTPAASEGTTGAGTSAPATTAAPKTLDEAVNTMVDSGAVPRPAAECLGRRTSDLLGEAAAIQAIGGVGGPNDDQLGAIETAGNDCLSGSDVMGAILLNFATNQITGIDAAKSCADAALKGKAGTALVEFARAQRTQSPVSTTPTFAPAADSCTAGPILANLLRDTYAARFSNPTEGQLTCFADSASTQLTFTKVADAQAGGEAARAADAVVAAAGTSCGLRPA